MYPNYIEIHPKGKDSKVMINVDQIVSVVRSAIVTTAPMIVYEAEESYEEITELIRSCGALINKGDPRIDTSRQLTIDDLENMIGDPVWNSNTGEWWLIYCIDTDNKVVIVCDSERVQEVWDEDYLSQHPLYRMRQECS